MQGLFQLQDAQGLLAKLRHDFGRLKADHVDVCAAFDFFVTARHLPEWLYPGDKTKQAALFDGSVLLRVCRHIADGSKHFQATSKQHDSVNSTALEGSVFQPGVFQSNAFQVGTMVVYLDGDAAITLGESIEVTDLARRVLDYWEAHPDLKQRRANTHRTSAST